MLPGVDLLHKQTTACTLTIALAGDNSESCNLYLFPVAALHWDSIYQKIVTGCWRKTSRGNLGLNLIVGFLDACMLAGWLSATLHLLHGIIWCHLMMIPLSFICGGDKLCWNYHTCRKLSDNAVCIDGVKEAGVDSAHTFCLCSVQQNYPLLVLKNGRLLLRSIWKYAPSIFLAQIPRKPAKIKILIKKIALFIPSSCISWGCYYGCSCQWGWLRTSWRHTNSATQAFDTQKS
jgi:hypothetical protein